MAFDKDLTIGEQILQNVRGESEITEELRREIMRRRRAQRRRAGFGFPVFNLLTEDGCNYILEDGTGVYLKEVQ